MEGGTVVPAAEQAGLGVHRHTGGRGREPQGYRILAWEGNSFTAVCQRQQDAQLPGFLGLG